MYPYGMDLSADDLERSFGSLLNRIEIFRERQDLSELSGGLTNRNLKVSTPTGKYVARISSNGSELLAIDRESEYKNSKIAASLGIGAPVHDYLPGEGLLVIGFIEGQTLDSVGVLHNLDRIAKSVKVLHSGPPFLRDFDMFQVQRNYLTIVLDRKFRIPADYASFEPIKKELQIALQRSATGLVPCNNDLLPANFIDDGTKIWLIDYEYSGNNDACFELGNIWSEAKLDFDALELLVNSYFGKVSPDKIARAWLYALMAKYGWTLWAAIQNEVSEIDFDFWSWGLEKYEDVQRDFNSAKYREMIALL